MDQLPISFGSRKNQFSSRHHRSKSQQHRQTEEKSDEQKILSSSSLGRAHKVEQVQEEDDDEEEGQTRLFENRNDNDDDMIGPPKPSSSSLQNPTTITIPEMEKSKFTNSNDDDHDEDDEDLGEFPIQRCSVLRGHEKAVTALAVDPSGSRVLTGSHDYHVKFWDFGGMDRDLHSFRSVVPDDGYPVCQLAYSSTGDKFASAMESAQPKIYDRDGFHLATMIKGDVYINDMKNTKGHTAAVKAVQWCPVNRSHIMTASADSTVRMWDVETCEKRHLWLTRARNARGTKTSITACALDRLGSKIAAGCLDGSLQIFDVRQHSRPQTVVRTAHEDQNDVTSVAFSRDDRTLISRSMDHTLKVWDVRKLQQPLKSFHNLINRYSQTDCIFSPDDEYILTGVSSDRGQSSSSADSGVNNGCLVFIEKQTLQMVQTVVPGESKAAPSSREATSTDGDVSNDMSVIRVAWHALLNQIFVGCSDGNSYIYYDEDLSSKGVLLSNARAPKKKHFDGMAMAAPIIVVPLEEKRMKRQLRKQQQMAKLQKHVPTKAGESDTAQTGPTIRLGSENYSHLMMRHIKKQDIDTDPRAALLKYDEEVKKNPYFVAPAYQESQPQTLLNYDAAELESKEVEEHTQRIYEESVESRFGGGVKRQSDEDSKDISQSINKRQKR